MSPVPDRPVSADDPLSLRAAADRAAEHHEAGDVDGALAVCAEVESAGTAAGAAGRDHPVVRESLVSVRFLRARIATEDGDLDAALAAYLSVAALPCDLDDPDQTHELAMALLNVGICWESGGDMEGALATYDDLLDRLGDATDPVTVEQVTKARVNRAVVLLGTDRTEEALAAADDVLVRLGDTTELLVAEQRGMALRIRGQALVDLGRLEEAVDTLAEADVLGDVDAPEVRAQALAASGERAEVLAALGRIDEAIGLLDDAVARHTGSAELDAVVMDLRRAEAELLEATGEIDRAAALRAALDG